MKRFALTILAVLFASIQLDAATRTVTKTSDTNDGVCDADCSLREAIAASAAGDTINFATELSRATISLTNQLNIGRDLIISGPSDGVTVDGTGVSRVFDITAGAVSISNLTITNGRVVGAPGFDSDAGGGPGDSAAGGGIQNSGTLTLTRCTLYNNSVLGGNGGAGTGGVTPPGGDGGAGWGGAIYNSGTLVLLNCTFNNNRAGGGSGHSSGGAPGHGGVGQGGAIYNLGSLQPTNCTVSGNAATGGNGGYGQFSGGRGGDGQGGGIYQAMGASAIPLNTIIARNSVTGGAGGSADNNGAPGTPSGPDVFGVFSSQGHNLIGDRGDSGNGTVSSGWVASDLTGTTGATLNPQLDPLSSIGGGRTATMALEPGSAAIDSGSDVVLNAPYTLTTDQRDAPRKIGAHVDIGAFEFDPPQSAPNFVVNTTHEHSDFVCGQGDCSLWDAANAADNDTSPNTTITFAPDVRGTITTAQQPEGIIVVRGFSTQGPGAKLLTISGGGSGRAFHIVPGANGVSISGLTIAGSVLQNGDGGAILNEGGLMISDCVFSGNQTFSGHGGAISNSEGASLAVNRCTFFFNVTSSGVGGAIDNRGTLSATNSTFASNTASEGGAIAQNFGQPTATIRNCTISGNTAQATNDGGGGIRQYVGTIRLGNSIVAGDSSQSDPPFFSPDLYGNFISDGHNIIGIDTGSLGFANGANGDQVGTSQNPMNPQLGPVADNGGSTPTMALEPNSPAINAANPATAPPTDQRGFFRAGAPDIGAFELSGTFFAGNLQNISTRGFVGTGDNVLIGGIIISGSGPKRVLVRALGPTLGQLGVHNVLANPTLELFTPVNGTQTLLASNDNWVDSTDHTAITATGLAPPNNLEAAILADLNPGNYTAIVRGVNGATGNALVDAYDLNETVPSKFGNISTRGFVQAGDSVMIAGVIINGAQSQNVLIRALGPTLSQFGVHNVLANPLLQLVEPNGMRITNDNWGDAVNASDISATGLAPPSNLESAILISLPTGNYTAILSGVGNTTGNALIEVYALN